MIANVFIMLALMSIIASIILYAAKCKELSLSKVESDRKISRLPSALYFASFAFLAISSIILFANIVLHNFQIAYVFEYSSRNLPKALLYSSFFAGQEGSFLFWAMIVAIFGIPLMRSTRGHSSHSKVMIIYSLFLAAFILLVLLNTPFKYIWDKYPDVFLRGFTPADGRSLNPILENFWMIIHPPFLFLGFSLLFVPFAIFVGNYINGTLGEAMKLIRKWQLFGSAILGIGLILGGVWAYESLGWGGWWGWDPVENASLVPWIISVIIIHLLIIQKKGNAFIRSNFALFFIQTMLIFYSTFLTRTGILQNSMHSFAGTSANTYYTLLAILLILFVSGLIIILKYNKRYSLTVENSSEENLAKEKNLLSMKSMHFYIASGMYVFLLIALFVFFGTSYPLVNSNFSIEPSFYNNINFIPIVISTFLLGIAYLIAWREKKSFKYLLSSIILVEVIALVLSYLYGATALSDLLFIAGASLVIAISLASIYVKGWRGIYTAMAHLGLGIMLVGIIFSGNYSTKNIISLNTGAKGKFNGKDITYIKSEQFDMHLKDRAKYRFVTAISSNSVDTIFAMPVMYIKDKQVYKEPAINSGFLKDIYVSPLALDSVIDKANPTQKTENFTFEISEEPLMSLVWIGSALLIIGTFMRGIRRDRKRKIV